MANMQFTPEQEQAILARGQNVLVSAAAGSGKTRVLVARLLDQIEQGGNVNDFLIITYTRAAANELRGRILDAISLRQAQNPSPHVRRQSAKLYSADIGTIHAFCSKIIREFAVQLDQNPEFKTLEESETRSLKEEIFDLLLEERYGNLEDFPGFSGLLDNLSQGRNDRALKETALDLHEKLLAHPQPFAWAATCLAQMDATDKHDAGDTIWGRFLLDNIGNSARFWLESLEQAARTFDEAFLKAYGPSWQVTIQGLARFVTSIENSWDAACNAVGFIEFPRASIRGEGYEQLKDLRRQASNAVKKWQEIFLSPSRDIFSDFAQTHPICKALFALVEDFELAYQGEKSRRGVLDFSDLEHLVLRLLRDPDTHAPTAYALEIAPRYRELMIDEFQDVSAIQDAIFSALSDCGTRRFMVGDVKQSIYRFRLADPTIFLKYYQRFPDADASGAPMLEQKVHLGKNFRSHPGILDAVNFLFTRLMSRQFGELDYGPDQALYPGKDSPIMGESSPVVRLDVLDLAHLDGEDKQEKKQAEAQHIAKSIQRLHLEEGVPYGDMAILLRSVSSRGANYEKALEDLNIPVQKLGDKGFFYTPEVGALVSFLFIILNPRQDVFLLSALSSPLFSFSPDDLASIRLMARDGSFFEALQLHGASCEKSAAFLDQLDKLRTRAPDLAPVSLLWHIINTSHALSIFGAMPGGDTRRANIYALLSLAQNFSSGGAKSLFDFVLFLEKTMEAGNSPATPPASLGAHGVKIMSIHKSKGLEFPVVFLPELSKRFNQTDFIRPVLTHPDLGIGSYVRDLDRKVRYHTIAHLAIARKGKAEMRAEELRVLYVAMTRAEQRLILSCALEDAQKTLGDLSPNTSGPLPPFVLESCSNVGQWVLLAAMSRPEATQIRLNKGLPVAPTNYPWEVRLITAGVEDIEEAAAPPSLEPRENTPAPPAPLCPSEPDLEETFSFHMNYVYPYAEAVDLPSKLTATQIKGRPIDLETAEDASAPARPIIFRQPGFLGQDVSAAQRGVLTHLVLQYLDFSACTSLAAIEAELARLVGEVRITQEDANLVSAPALWQLFHGPLGLRLQQAKNQKREFKFSILVSPEALGLPTAEDEILLQGVVDCYIEEPEGICVIDFKTDYIPPGTTALEKAESYRPQLNAYALALQQILGKPVSEQILYFLSTGETVVVT